MGKNNIFIEAEYEFKRVRRSILFRIFAILALLGAVVYQYSFLSCLLYTSDAADEL